MFKWAQYLKNVDGWIYTNNVQVMFHPKSKREKFILIYIKEMKAVSGPLQILAQIYCDTILIEFYCIYTIKLYNSKTH